MQGSDLPRSVQILAHVLPNPDSAYPLAFDPYKLDISQFGEKKRTEIEFDVINRSEDEIQIEVLSFNEEFLIVDMPEKVGPNERVKGLVKVHESKVDESFDKSITIAATGPHSKKPARFTLPVKRAVRKLDSRVNSAMSPPKPKGSGGSK